MFNSLTAEHSSVYVWGCMCVDFKGEEGVVKGSSATKGMKAAAVPLPGAWMKPNMCIRDNLVYN